MIAVDTNVLLRRLLNDDPSQTAKARELFESGQEVLITDVVLVETLWTIKGKRYRANRADIARTVESLLEEPCVVFENQQVIWSALCDFVATERADYPDALIVNKAKHTAKITKRPYRGTYTFDAGALHIQGTQSP